MTRKAGFLAIAFALAIMAGNIFANQTSSPKTPAKHNAALYTYTWYYDPDFVNPVGSVSDINTEINRLRNIYPFNTFSTSPGGVLQGYEWGYYQYSTTAIIYSDL